MSNTIGEESAIAANSQKPDKKEVKHRMNIRIGAFVPLEGAPPFESSTAAMKWLKENHTGEDTTTHDIVAWQKRVKVGTVAKPKTEVSAIEI